MPRSLESWFFIGFLSVTAALWWVLPRPDPEPTFPAAVSYLDWSQPDPVTRATLTAVTFGGHLFVATGQGGTTLTSPDGLEWQVQHSSTDRWLFGVAYGGDQYVAVGQDGIIINSQDGKNWVLGPSPVSTSLFSVTYGEGTFVAVGADGTVIFSEDGTTWERASSPTGDSLLSVAYNWGRFAAVGDDILLMSDDGSSWTQVRLAEHYMTAVASADNEPMFVGVGAQGLTYRFYDGGTYSGGFRTRTQPNLYGITCARNRCVAVGPYGEIQHGWYNLLDLEKHVSPTAEDLFAVAYGNGRYVAVGARGEIVVSNRLQPEMEGIAYGAGRFVAAGSDGTILSSAEGRIWSRVQLDGSFQPDDIAFGNGTFLVVGNDGRGDAEVYRSTDGTTWSKAVFPHLRPVYSLAFGNGRFVGVVHESQIAATGDGKSWVTHEPNSASRLTDVAWTGQWFVATAADGEILVSEDGTQWDRKSIGVEGRFQAVAGEGDQIVLVDYSGDLVAVSTEDWQGSVAKPGPWHQEKVRDLQYISGQYVAVDQSDRFLLSANGVDWRCYDPDLGDVDRIAYGEGVYVTLGWASFQDDWVMFYSQDGQGWLRGRFGEFPG